VATHGNRGNLETPREAIGAAGAAQAGVVLGDGGDAGAVLYASAAPTPLYRVYQAEWGFSTATLTAVFAIYVLFVLATLLIFGSRCPTTSGAGR
jgi:hypothetical protein